MDLLIVLAGFGAIAALIFLVGRWWENHCAEAWRRAAEELGLAYHGPENDLLARFGRLATLRRGRQQRIANAIVGADGDVEVVVADFRFVTGSGKSTRRNTETLCILHRPGLALPACRLRPQSRLFDYLGKLFGGQDIDFPEDPDFSSAYVLQGHLPEAIRRLFDDATRAWFTERRSKRLHFEADRDLLVFHSGRKIKPQQARELIAQALQIRTLLEDRTAAA